MRYSIVFCEFGINERLSVGIITNDGFTYSNEKVKILKKILNRDKYNVFYKILKNLNENVNVDYLSRYSNNLISFSEWKHTDECFDRLYNRLVWNERKI